MDCQIFELASSLVMSNCRAGEVKEEFTKSCEYKSSKNDKNSYSSCCVLHSSI